MRVGEPTILMFRRIELIHHFRCLSIKDGLCGISEEEVADAWADDLPSPTKRLNKNCRFYFTEQGWEQIGRKVIDACIRSGQEYRVISVKEKSVDVFYRDELQVAVRHRKVKY